MKIKRALISVSDKSGIVEFAQELIKMGVEIISTGGTAKALTNAGVKVTGISEVTGFPECLDGRVKTLHPRIHGGLLALRDNDGHMSTLESLHIEPIDMVIVNLYPFRKTIEKADVGLEEAIENIDIGGPSMLRAGAKNYRFVTVVVDPIDYEIVLYEMKNIGDVTENTKFKLASKVFAHTAHYDTLIASYLWQKAEMEKYPDIITMTFEKAQDLRYGENPHQGAAYYKEIKNNSGTIAGSEQLHGKELSFNNINDANAALLALKEFGTPAVVAVKHANPCGVGIGDNIYEAYMKSYNADKISIFGGIIALNREVDEKTAEEVNKIFVEIIIAPSYTIKALETLKKKANIRIMKLEDISFKQNENIDMKKVGGGLLLQDSDDYEVEPDELQYVTEKTPTENELEDLLFAWKVVKHVKSNAIVVAKDGMTLGIGPGQVNRIWAAQSAIERAGDTSKGAVMASDAFFPFDDVVNAAAQAGIKAIIQPGGSINDQKSIDACNKLGIVMVFTGVRHFRH